MHIIRYNRSQFRGSYFSGLLWLLLSLIILYTAPELNWKNILYVIMGLVYTSLFFFDREQNYVLIDEKNIIVKGFFNRKIKIDQIKDVSYEIDKIIIRTDKRSVKINLNLIHRDDLSMAKQLNHYLASSTVTV